MIKNAISALVAAVALVLGSSVAAPTASPATAWPRGCCRADPSHRPLIRPATNSTLLLGDSYTAGVNSRDDVGYRAFLKQARPGMKQVGTQTGSQGPGDLHEGHSGWKIAQLTALYADGGPLASWLTVNPPQFCLLYIGANDVGLGSNRTTAQMLADLSALLSIIHRRSPLTYVYVGQLSSVPINTTSQNAQLTAYNDGMPALAATLNGTGRQWVRIVDQRDVVTLADPGDGVHPSYPAGYSRMAQHWAAALPEVLTS
jgi:lysophospholipase L1-like esterase